MDDATKAAVAALDQVASCVGALARAHADGSRLGAAISVLLDAPGRVAVSGLGKSGHVAAKLAATMSSTGTPAFYVHAADALHGDSGALQAGDVLLAVSNSGETSELVSFASMAAERGVPIVSITGCDGRSALARVASVWLDAAVDRECDPDDLVPTASTTAAVALGDALAVGLMVARGFGPTDFARHHPGGALGERLR